MERPEFELAALPWNSLLDGEHLGPRCESTTADLGTIKDGTVELNNDEWDSAFKRTFAFCKNKFWLCPS
jgi:hypothetical protein